MPGNLNATPPILIVGAGPTGLTLAVELLRHGAACRVIDKAPTASATSKAIAVQSRTLELFANLGIADEAVSEGQILHGMNLYAGGRRIAHLSFDELDSPYPFMLALPQSETERALGACLERLGGRIEREVELQSFSQDSTSVTAMLRHADGQEETFTTPWIAGCDGAHSTVRQVLGIGFEGSQYPESWALADLTVHWPLPNDEAYAFFHPDGAMLIFPLKGGAHRVYAEVATPGDQAPPAEPSFADFQRIIMERGPSGTTVSDPVWMSPFHISRRHAMSYRQGRAFLAGDAMHIHSPAGGQGMNTGIQDAANLAWKLALVAQGRSPVSLLDSYDLERQQVVKGVLQLSDVITRLGTLRNPIATELRDRLVPLLVGTEVIQQRAMRRVAELSVSYRHSPIVAEYGSGYFSGGPRAGDRAPDAAPLQGAATSLHELLRGPNHTLLLIAGAEPEAEIVEWLERLARSAEERYGALIKPRLIAAGQTLPAGTSDGAGWILDRELTLHHHYAAERECLYLIRPDGYIAFRSLPADTAAFDGYLGQIFT